MSVQPLFTPIRVGDLHLPNRIVMAPLTGRSTTCQTGRGYSDYPTLRHDCLIFRKI
jgi:2,4-dienoyl-CoA reductase-like NADH-dependent reductase (Old Yellow Enzyme family)